MFASIPTAGPPVTVRFVHAPELTGDTHADQEAIDAAERNALVWVFHTQALPGAEWERLLSEHPAIKAGHDFNPDTFPQALIVASITGYERHDGDKLESRDGPLSEDEANELWSTWPQWARTAIFGALNELNVDASPGKARRSMRTASAALARQSIETSPT